MIASVGDGSTMAPSPTNHLPVLDGVRGIAILLVMQYHYWGLVFGRLNRQETLTIDIWTHRFFGLGWAGVDLFFVLSGFLITGVLFDVKGRMGYLRSFYGRRALRIVPVYVLFLACVLFVLPILPLSDAFVATARVDELRDVQFWYWTYLLNIGASLNTLDVQLPLVHSHFWSLAIEEQFYILWPFVVLAFGRRSLMGLCFALVGIALAFRIAIVHDATFGVFNVNAAFIMMPARMDTLALGALIALAMRGTELRTLQRLAPAVALLSAAVLVVIFVRDKGLQSFDANVLQYGLTAIALLAASLLLLVLQAPPHSLVHSALSIAPLRIMGRYSYAMYVVHLLISFELARAFAVRGYTNTVLDSHIPMNIIFSAAATAATLLVAWLSWHIVEAPISRLKSWFQYGQPASPPQAVGDMNGSAVSL